LTRIPNHDMKNGMEEYLRTHSMIKGIVAGTRRTDPFSAHLCAFCHTDNGWPEFTRINPILDWEYQDVWRVMLTFKIPYCHLYDRGYTSLGSVHNTHPNPYLRSEGGFLPAFNLQDGSHERDGRLTKEA